ncbi:MAG: extracellular solute-binding protein [Defluviitaleaceae bacterium]|nr:extracellular solute-binding protein [Defluviitaleaceae bacterium]MCL2275120.1 extracellular solute-binding protein [Defluviitaleaceae bacterium]
MRQKYLKRIFIFAVFVLLLIFSACGRGNRDASENERNDRTNNATAAYISPATRLTVAVTLGMQDTARQAGEAFQTHMAQQGIWVHIDYEIIFDADMDTYFPNLLSRFASGKEPDLFFIPSNESLVPFIEYGFLADIYTLIDDSSILRREDFFTNVLDALLWDGQLYVMPISFTHGYIGINASIPQYFIDRFAALDCASLSNTVALYLDLIDEYPQFAEYAFINSMEAWRFFEPELNRFIDMGNQTADFLDESLVALFEQLRAAYNGGDAANINFRNIFAGYDEMEEIQSNYIFKMSRIIWGMDAIFDFNRPFFIHHTPWADNAGRIITEHSISMAVSQNADPIALYFLWHLIEQAAMGDVPINALNMPTVRSSFYEHVETALRGNAHRMNRTVTGVFEQIPFIVDRMYQYADRAAATPITPIYLSRTTFADTFNAIMASDVTAQVAINQLEQYFKGWLNPAFVITPLPEIATAEVLPIRTLTIKAEERNIGIIRQAAAMMSQSWAQEERDYTFRIEIDSYRAFLDDAEARLTRLQVELMAGSGPDMFILGQQPIRAYAQSGLLANIHDLMDACPRTNSNDFFTQALKAHEINGGLYMFPLSFGFHYVAINANAPQSMIDRFSALPGISIAQLFQLYHDIMAAYGDDSDPLTIVQSGYMMGLRSGLFNGFIDFDARTANLMDDRFIALLDNWAPLDPWDGRTTGGTVAERGTVNLPADLRGMARHYMFMIESESLHPGSAFFEPAETHFLHHIPLTDEEGRLLVCRSGHVFSPIWATVCITAAGDSALAWEFTQFLIAAYSQPTPQAVGRWPKWGQYSIASPIYRPLFNGHIGRAMEMFTGRFTGDDFIPRRAIAADNPDEIAQGIELARTRIAAYNEMPMIMMDPLIPIHLFEEPLNHLSWGLATPRETAQQLQNAISLWLIE